MKDDEIFLLPRQFIDCDHPSIREFANHVISRSNSAADRVIALYYRVRDEIRYDVYINYTDPKSFRASSVLAAERGFCVGEAAVYSACCRMIGIAVRVGHADVKKHITFSRLHALMRSNVFRWHAFVERRLGYDWIETTPAFDLSLCERVGFSPLEFDGQTDPLLPPCDADGERRMEYLGWRGSFADVPFETILAAG